MSGRNTEYLGQNEWNHLVNLMKILPCVLLYYVLPDTFICYVIFVFVMIFHFKMPIQNSFQKVPFTAEFLK